MLCGAAAFLAPVYELRPNRIASGTPERLLEAPALAHSAAALLALIAAYLVLRGRKQSLASLASKAAAPLLALLQVLLLLSPGLHFAGPEGLAASPSYRVSPASGFWALQGMAVFGLAWAFSAGGLRQRRPAALLAAMPALAAAGTAAALIAGGYAGLLEVFSPWKELRSQGPRFWAELGRHLYLSGVSFAAATVLGIAGAAAASRNPKAEAATAALAASVQNIPSLALFGLLLPVLAKLSSTFPALRDLGISGIGAAPAILALTAYGMLPVVLSTLAGLRMVDPGAVDAAGGMGMGPAQILFKVELPLALPSIAAGARTALVQTIGTATVAALVGAGGMGYFIFQGVGQASMDMVVLGVVPVVLLSLTADRGMAALAALAARKGGRRWP